MRRGTWSRVFRRGVDFIPMKLCGVPSCLALGVGALSGGAQAVGSPTASAWFPPDARLWAHFHTFKLLSTTVPFDL